MAEGDGGSIINVTTAGTLRPSADDLPYAMAKAGLNALTLGLAGAWAPKVRANLVLPGAFDTDITKAWDPDMKIRAGEINPMQRIGRPEDMVGVCVFLASDAPATSTGPRCSSTAGSSARSDAPGGLVAVPESVTDSRQGAEGPWSIDPRAVTLVKGRAQQSPVGRRRTDDWT